MEVSHLKLIRLAGKLHGKSGCIQVVDLLERDPNADARVTKSD